jgi:hypothetical protein
LKWGDFDFAKRTMDRERADHAAVRLEESGTRLSTPLSVQINSQKGAQHE